MDTSLNSRTNVPASLFAAAGENGFGEQRGLGMSCITFKGTPQDSYDLLIIEETFREKGEPARHLHYGQEEWFCVVEGEFIFEAGREKLSLKPGDSLLAPRQVPHIWSHTGGRRGRVLNAFMPTGKMGSFFREIIKSQPLATASSGIVESSRHGINGSTLSGGLGAAAHFQYLKYYCNTPISKGEHDES
jgi:mannose-6-phosphate isomerase-like protein (cupin superfamily)